MTVFNKLGINEDINAKESFADNHFHNILRLFDVLATFLSPQVKRCAIITYKDGMYKLHHQLPND